MRGWLWRWLKGPESDDGLGLPFHVEIAMAQRVGRLRRADVTWRTPTAEERALYDEHPLIERFADDTIAIADVEGHRWVVQERMWHGWPDPPRFCAFAFDGDELWAAQDFDWWPRGWSGVSI